MSAMGGWDGEAVRLGCAWWSRLDGRWLVEVHYVSPPERESSVGPDGLTSVKGYLRVFDKAREFALLHEEPTTIIEGARFGPDVRDVAKWQLRAMDIVDASQP